MTDQQLLLDESSPKRVYKNELSDVVAWIAAGSVAGSVAAC